MQFNNFTGWPGSGNSDRLHHSWRSQVDSPLGGIDNSDPGQSITHQRMQVIGYERNNSATSPRVMTGDRNDEMRSPLDQCYHRNQYNTFQSENFLKEIRGDCSSLVGRPLGLNPKAKAFKPSAGVVSLSGLNPKAKVFEPRVSLVSLSGLNPKAKVFEPRVSLASLSGLNPKAKAFEPAARLVSLLGLNPEAKAWLPT